MITTKNLAIMEEHTDNELSLSIIHEIFNYNYKNFKLLIHKEGSTDEERNEVLSIEIIMKSGLEGYFGDVLLSNKFRRILCNEACKRGYLNTLKWARANGCPWSTDTCEIAASAGHLHILQWARANGCPWNLFTCS